ncbi:MAG: Qat anti-phage system associated protein QatB [Candidatus Cryosericum sp.]
MGTSNPYGGPGGNNPLVPTWLESNGNGEPSNAPNDALQDDGAPDDDIATSDAPMPLSRPVPQPPPSSERFRTARNNFTRFASSGGSDRASLGRAISGYVGTASGGARKAAQRMGSSRRAGARLLGFLSDVRTRGVREALRALDLEHLAGRPIKEIFVGLTDYVCPEGGTIDEGIPREAFIETIVDLTGLGITNLDALTTDQMQTVFEFFATHAIEARLCNDIGTKVIALPRDVHTASDLQAQLRDFIARGVSDALTTAQMTPDALTPDRVLGFVGSVYEEAFQILQTMGEEEAGI